MEYFNDEIQNINRLLILFYSNEKKYIPNSKHFKIIEPIILRSSPSNLHVFKMKYLHNIFYVHIKPIKMKISIYIANEFKYCINNY